MPTDDSVTWWSLKSCYATGCLDKFHSGCSLFYLAAVIASNWFTSAQPKKCE